MDWLQLWIFFLCFLLTSSAECPKGKGCSACQLISNEYEIECAMNEQAQGFAIVFKPNEFIKITCHKSPKWSDFHLGTIQKMQNVKAILFKFCELPKSRKLSSITQQILVDDIEELDFRSIEMDMTLHLTRDDFKELTKLKRLTLCNNVLVNITSDMFHDLDNLVVLNLRSNNIENLPDDFLIMPNLKVIELGMNKIQVIEPRSFGNLEKLEFLNIWNNRLTEIKPHTFDKLKSLESIDINSNKLQFLPEDIFTNLARLKVLNLSQNNFTKSSLAQNLLRNNKNLKTIKLIENKQSLKTLPDKFFANLTNLTTIQMNKNGLNFLPEDLLLGTTSLSDFIMEHNSFTTLPKNIFQHCNNLSIIKLSFNQINYLPEGIFLNLRQLKELNLSNNRITNISMNLFDGLTSLEILNMGRNKIKTIHSQGLRALGNLRIAKFSHNQLTLKDVATYEDEYGLISPFHYTGESIKELHLENNNITDIFSDWILATHLQYLNLAHNKLDKVTYQDLQFISENLRVDLTYNNIKLISLEESDYFLSIEKVFKNRTILVNNNPLVCDCKIYNLLRYLERNELSSVENRFHLKVDNLTCHEPIRLQNRLITTFQSKSLICLVKYPEQQNATCPNKCQCWIKPSNRAYIIDCSSRGFTIAPTSIKAPNGYHIELNLTDNYLTDMPSINQPGYENVTVLLLGHNNITNIPLQAISQNLQVLNLEKNYLTKIDTFVLDNVQNLPNLNNLTLHDNMWKCDCEARDFFKFIQTLRVRIPELQKVTCESTDLLVFEMTPEELCPKPTSWIVSICIGVALISIVIGILAPLYYRYKQEIMIWLYARQWCLWWVTEDELDKDKLYDAFISYSHKDDDFVANQLVAILEEGPRPFKLCVHYRDWPAGEWIPNQVARSVQDSRRTIVVLSPNFLESEWGKMEFRAAHHQALNDCRARVIVIIYGEIPPTDELDPELQSYLRMNTYVKWGDPWFWNKLRFALPHANRMIKKNKNLAIMENFNPTIYIDNNKSSINQVADKIPTISATVHTEMEIKKNSINEEIGLPEWKYIK